MKIPIRANSVLQNESRYGGKPSSLNGSQFVPPRNAEVYPRPHQVGTSKVAVAVVEAAPFNIVIGNTHPDSTEEIITTVLKKVAEQVSSDGILEKPLEISEVECLTKPREDGRRIWSKT